MTPRRRHGSVVLGCVVDGLRVSVMSANIRFTVGEVVLGGLLLSVVVGLVGGLLPAHGASRTPVVEAMRSLCAREGQCQGFNR